METTMLWAITNANNSFKSYYVVWKPTGVKEKHNQKKFKSYYVVWKHHFSTQQKKKIHGLNRTM